MHTSIQTTIAALILSAAFVGTAAANVSTQSLQSTVQSALGGSGQVQVSVQNGVATLIGYVDDASTELAVKRAASNYPGVERIVDLITES